MTSVVIDASAAIAMIAATQATDAISAFAAAPPGPLLAPTHFNLEVRHAMVRLERRGLLAVGRADADLALLESLIAFAPPPDRATFAEALNLARAEALSVYDAVCLDLALRSAAALASRDGALLAAAQRRGLVVHDLR
ncbi:MAG: PIN domain-containing protein [Terricaulis sp.]